MENKDYKETNMLPAIYAVFYPMLRKIAIKHGYALALHGSLSRDLDVIAVAWVEEPKPYMDMIKAMGKCLGQDNIWTDKFIEDKKIIKPHGRIGFALCTGNGYMDISIIPPRSEQEISLLLEDAQGNVNQQLNEGKG